MNLTPAMQESRKRAMKKAIERRKISGFKPRKPKNRKILVSPKKRLNKPVSIKKKPISIKRKPIRKVSAKRAEQNKIYKRLRELFLRVNPLCQVYPFRQATEVHHTYSGKDRSKHFLQVSTWMAVSREGHNHIHDHPKEAREKGWLK